MITVPAEYVQTLKFTQHFILHVI